MKNRFRSKRSNFRSHNDSQRQRNEQEDKLNYIYFKPYQGAVKKLLFEEGKYFKDPDKIFRKKEKTDKSSRKKEKNENEKIEIMKSFLKCPFPYERYSKWLDNYKKTLKKKNVEFLHFKTSTRLIVGLGMESPLETGISFLYPFNVPYIPGSAIKGIVRRYLDESIADCLLGRSADSKGNAQKGRVVFFDAVVSTEDSSPKTYGDLMERDVMTPHYSQYYSSKGENPPLWGPIPIQFLVVKKGIKFIFPILIENSASKCCNNPKEKIINALKIALEENGIGAKTRVNYGRMMRVEE